MCVLNLRAISTLALLVSSLLNSCALASPPPFVSSVPTEITSPASGDSFAPRIVADGDGLILSWIEAIAPSSASDVPATKASASAPASTPSSAPAAVPAKTHRLCLARFSAGAWSAVSVIASGNDLFANWADTPTVVRSTDGSLLVTWLRQGAAGGYVYDAVVSRSDDDGASWKLLGPLHDDAKAAEHGFVSADSANGTTAFCWLDGRAMATSDAHADDHDHGGGGDMTLRAARVAPNSARVSPPSEILDERTCECCPTDLAIGKNGPIIVYRDRREDGTRDISLVRWLGEGWSQPQSIGNDRWMLNGCPVNGPSISAAQNAVIVAWWTGEPDEGAVRAVRSTDGGATFSPVIDIDTDGSIGRVETLLLPSGDAIILWYDLVGKDGIIAMKRLAPDGTLGALHTLAKVSVERSSGFPRAALVGSDVWFTCTARGNGSIRSVKVFCVPVESVR